MITPLVRFFNDFLFPKLNLLQGKSEEPIEVIGFQILCHCADLVIYLQASFRARRKKRAAGYLKNTYSTQTAMDKRGDHTSFTPC